MRPPRTFPFYGRLPGFILCVLYSGNRGGNSIVSRGQTLFRAERYRLQYSHTALRRARALILQAITPYAEEGLAMRDYGNSSYLVCIHLLFKSPS